MQAALLSLATALPPHRLRQEEAKAIARRRFSGANGLFARLETVFDHAGIATRQLARPAEWYLEEAGWQARNAAYLESADALYTQAASRALAAAKLEAAEVDTLVTVSTTGIATPSLEARAASALGFRPDAERVPLFGLGCAGGVSGLALAARLAASGRVVLFVTVELCSLAFRGDKSSKANIVATALFGDGAAACLLAPGDGGIAQVGPGAEHLWPDTLGIMGWNVEDPGLDVVFDRSIPPFIETELAGGLRMLEARCGGTVDRFVCHPGGAKVIAALESSLGLQTGSLDHERAVLRECGNMSAPTVLFVLQRLIESGLPERAMLLALGPGFTLSGLRLERRP
ncbi:MAG: type III polyketide synthase [Chromatiales bacterium]|nr:type III polyketide synthase [Chromatiales bacterium]